jgi:EmrB/QacA subfamily drug resistance transporter
MISSVAGSGAQQPSPRRWLALAVCLVAGFMTLLDVTMVNVALPSIRSGVHASSSDMQWILSGYALAFGLVLAPAGRLGDARGRRNVFLAGLALFTLASAAAGLSPNPGWLIAARLLQGAAAGVLNPQIPGLIQDVFQKAERGRAFGLLGAAVGVSAAAGGLLAGAIISLAGRAGAWHWVFYVNVPVGLITLPLAYRFFPVTRPGARLGKRENLDPIGVLLLGAGFVVLFLPLTERQWHGSVRWLLFLAAVVLIAAFAGWERHYARHHRPVVGLSLFRLRSYTSGSTIAFLHSAGITGIFFVVTLYVQNGLQYSATRAGLFITPFALGSATTAAIGGRLVAKIGKPLLTAGLGLAVAGLAGAGVASHLAPGRHAALATALWLLVAGIGDGLVIPSNQTHTLAEVPPAEGGSAAGVMQTGQRIGSAIGMAAAASVFFAALTATRGSYLRAFQAGLMVVIALVVAALVIALFDMIAEQRTALGGRGGHAGSWFGPFEAPR